MFFVDCEVIAMIKAVVFDLDDTLYDEADYCRSGLRAVSEYLAQRPDMPAEDAFFRAFMQEFEQGDRTRIFNNALDKLGVEYDSGLISELIRLYREHEPDITLPEQSREILENLQKKYTLAMLTDGFLPAQKLKVRALGIEHFFRMIVYTEQLGREFWKPSPVGFRKLLEVLRVAPEAMVYVGDNRIKDFIGPKQLGIATVELLRDNAVHRCESDDASLAADYQITSLGQLPGVLEVVQGQLSG